MYGNSRNVGKSTYKLLKLYIKRERKNIFWLVFETMLHDAVGNVLTWSRCISHPVAVCPTSHISFIRISFCNKLLFLPVAFFHFHYWTVAVMMILEFGSMLEVSVRISSALIVHLTYYPDSYFYYPYVLWLWYSISSALLGKYPLNVPALGYAHRGCNSTIT